MRWGILLLLCCCTAFLFAQKKYTTKATANEKMNKLYDRALDYVRFEQYQQAIAELEKIIRLDSSFIDAQLLWADTRHDMGVLEDAVKGYHRALSIDTNYNPTVFYKLGLSQIKMGQNTAGAQTLHRFLQTKGDERLKNKARKYIRQAEFTARAIENPVPFNPQKLSENINTPGPEYLPSLTADGTFLVYTAIIDGQEDFYFSEKINGDWQKGQPITAINTFLNEGGQNISADGKLLVFTACQRRDGLGSCDIYFSELQNTKWTKPRNIGAPINSGAWESQPSLAADGKALFFASDRKGGAGGRDIWVSYRKPDGTWGTPQNLGNTINTPGEEQTPFIHPDGETLYFMSDGHPGMGGTDLFLARKNVDGTWGTPQNLGYPINTAANEGALVVSLDGTTAYFATDESALHKDRTLASHQKNIDIYSFELYPAARPQLVTYVKAKIFDSRTLQTLSAKVECFNLKTEAIYATATTDEAGEFLLCLPLGKNYALNVSKEKYLFHSENFSLSAVSSIEQPFLLEIGLTPIEEASPDAAPSKPVVLKNVFFETGSAALLPESTLELKRLKSLLESNPDLKIRINGHTDDVGSEADNLALSEKRAKAVYHFLIENGINAQRLRYKGFGESQPIDSNNSPKGRQRNRRTEFEPIR